MAELANSVIRFTSGFLRLDLETGQLAQPKKSKKGKKKPVAAKSKRASPGKKESAPPEKKAVTKKVVVKEKKPFLKRVRNKLLKWAAIIVALMFIIPLVLTILYRPSFVHPISTLMITKWVQGEKVTRTWVPIEDISPFVYQSVISSEDGRFCFHNGVDWNAINIVVDDLLEGESPRGASTLPMQTVKNLYLWPSRSYIRKVLEVPLAMMVDAIWSKRRMMEIYLNIAEWGPGIYGIEAAARHHFNRSAKKLSRRQAALLTVSLPNPKLRNPRKPKRGLRRLARLVEKRAKASGAYVKCVKN